MKKHIASFLLGFLLVTPISAVVLIMVYLLGLLSGLAAWRILG